MYIVLNYIILSSISSFLAWVSIKIKHIYIRKHLSIVYSPKEITTNYNLSAEHPI